MSLDEFVRGFWLARGVPESKMQNASYFHHLLSWWEHRKDDDVLLLFYEGTKHTHAFNFFSSLSGSESGQKVPKLHKYRLCGPKRGAEVT